MEQQRRYGQEFKLGAAQLIKRLGLLDDFKTFWIEKPYPGFFEYVAA